MSFKLNRLRAGLAGAVAVIALASTAAFAAPTSVDLVFYDKHFEKFENGSVITYKFVRKADDPKLAPSFEDVVNVKVGPAGNENSVTIDLFSGARAVNMPNMSKTGAPVIVAVLQQDVEDMNKALGGSPFYFRNRLLQALKEAPAEPTKIDYQGKSVDGWKIAFKPFSGDAANRGKLREFADRSYELIFSEAVPGGLYALKSVTPKSDGGSLLTEELTVAGGPEAGAKSGATTGAKTEAAK